jgi:hypothetical protein
MGAGGAADVRGPRHARERRDGTGNEYRCRNRHPTRRHSLRRRPTAAKARSARKVEVPVVAIVQFHDGKLAHEHIYWDQASVLVQIGLLDPDNLPVAGVAEARKMVDKTLPSNALMPNWAKSDGKPI